MTEREGRPIPLRVMDREGRPIPPGVTEREGRPIPRGYDIRFSRKLNGCWCFISIIFFIILICQEAASFRLRNWRVAIADSCSWAILAALLRMLFNVVLWWVTIPNSSHSFSIIRNLGFLKRHYTYSLNDFARLGRTEYGCLPPCPTQRPWLVLLHLHGQW